MFACIANGTSCVAAVHAHQLGPVTRYCIHTYLVLTGRLLETRHVCAGKLLATGHADGSTVIYDVEKCQVSRV